MKEKDSKKSSQLLKESFSMTPPADGWSRLDAELERKQAVVYRQKANRFKRLSILLALLLLSSISYYYLSPSSSTSRQMASSVAPKENNVSPSLNESTKKVETTSESYNNSISGSSLKNNPKTLNEAVDGYVNQTTVSNSQKELRSAKKSSHRNSARPALNFHANSMANTSPSALKKENGLVADSKPVPNESVTINNGEATADKIERPASNNSPANDAQSSEGNTNATSDNNTISSGDESKKAVPEENNSSTAALPAKNIAADSLPLTLPPVMSPVSRWTLSVFFSPHYSRNHLQNNSSNGVDYISKYHDREKSMFSYGTGFMIRYNLSNHWSVSSGGIYSTLAYSITIPAIHARAYANNEVYYTYPTSCGIIQMPDNYGGTPVHAGDSMMNAGCTQVVEFINVPLMIRYELKKDRFTLFGEGGVSANFVLQEQAKVTVANTETTVTNNIYGLQDRNYSYIIGAGAEYKVYNGIGVFMEPIFKGSITSLTRNTVVNCYPYSFGVNVGASFHF
jgi:hypothetical protein